MAPPKRKLSEKFGWFFGKGIGVLDPTEVPVESDVVRLCIHVFDDDAKNPKENILINRVKDILIQNVRSQNESAILIKESSIYTWIKRLLLRANKYDLRYHAHKRDHVTNQTWIDSEKTKKFNEKVNIIQDTETEPTLKRKFFEIDDNEQVLKAIKCIHSQERSLFILCRYVATYVIEKGEK